ncbi:MAG: hypothetical protein C4563_06825 [Desulfobulbus sp.]|nr:MAG: hypothetical protein C4563_06825 [Desulfobulbus sp.]
MDKLDKWTIFFVMAMAAYASVLMAQAGGTPEQRKIGTAERQERQQALTPEVAGRIQLAKNLLIQDNLAKAEPLLETLITEFPYEGELYLLKGDILMRRQQPIAAMYEYKEAILLNPDFLDKKTRQFQGKKIKVSVEEAMTAIDDGLAKKPGDGKLREDRETLYFMKRKLAGSCG